MKTVFDKPTREELINRINNLEDNSAPQWGKMTVCQMLKHCRLWEEMIQTNKKYKRVLLGYLFGKMALKQLLQKDIPIKPNSPTIPELVVKDHSDLHSERTKWISLIESYASFPHAEFLHPFFGRMTKEQIGYFAYKHSDHHLRQFSC